jgi:hypothetical protein
MWEVTNLDGASGEKTLVAKQVDRREPLLCITDLPTKTGRALKRYTRP